MMVGHAAAAFALAAAAAGALGYGRERAVPVGLAAAGFAAVPDVDMAYALVGLAGAGAGGSGIWGLVDGFWAGSTVTHRGATHSLVVGIATAGIVTAAARHRTRWVAALAAIGLVAAVGAVSGPIAAATASIFVVAGVAVAVAASSGFGLSTPAVAAAALVGMLSHPFGDVFTGEPPAVLYPFDVALFDGRVALAADPTVNLVSVFLLELAVIWLAIVVGFRLFDSRLLPRVGTRAVVGLCFVGAFFLLQPPTLQRSYHFVFPAVGLAMVGPMTPSVLRDRSLVDAVAAAVTAIAAISVAVLTYGAVYLVHVGFL
jgi:membrane-bound metal-dependent hydrolase YbcI (DUF457 family)